GGAGDPACRLGVGASRPVGAGPVPLGRLVTGGAIIRALVSPHQLDADTGRARHHLGEDLVEEVELPLVGADPSDQERVHVVVVETERGPGRGAGGGGGEGVDGAEAETVVDGSSAT